MTRKIDLREIKGGGSPPPKTVILRLLSYFSKNVFQKNQKRMRWTSLEHFLNTSRLQLISFLNSKFSSTFHGVLRLFARTKVRKN